MTGARSWPPSRTSSWWSTPVLTLLSTVGRWEIGLRQGGVLYLRSRWGYPALPTYHIKNTLSSFNTPLLQGREIPRCLPGNSGLSESISYFRLSSGEIRFFLRKVHASTVQKPTIILYYYSCICVFVYLYIWHMIISFLINVNPALKKNSICWVIQAFCFRVFVYLHICICVFDTHECRFWSVSYTHLTLPTIYSV